MRDVGVRKDPGVFDCRYARFPLKECFSFVSASTIERFPHLQVSMVCML